MKIVKVQGGLGNQMFQYALYLSLKEIFNDVKLDITQFELYYDHYGYELEKVFGVNPELATKDEIERLTSDGSSYYRESQFNYDEEVLNLEGERYFEGCWQSEKYFRNIEEIVREEFSYKHDLEGLNKETAEKINKGNSVSIHIRRGDYLGSDVHSGVCTPKYYYNAVNIIRNITGKPQYYIFSDDLKWSRENIRPGPDTIYVDWNRGEDSYKDMHLMSLCKYNIIANSTFSWWAAWLNKNPIKMIIAPDRWFSKDYINTNDIIPERWNKARVSISP